MFAACSKSTSCLPDEELTTARKVKDGQLLRYKLGFLGSKWTPCYMVLMNDSRLLLFNNDKEQKATEYFILSETLPYMCVGVMTDKLRARRPPLPEDANINNLVGIALDSSGMKASWLLFPNDTELEDWLQKIIQLLPKLPNNGQHLQVDDQRPRSASENGLNGITAFGGGLLAGALVGYGIGSIFHPELTTGPPDLSGASSQKIDTTLVDTEPVPSLNFGESSELNEQHRDSQQTEIFVLAEDEDNLAF